MHCLYFKVFRTDGSILNNILIMRIYLNFDSKFNVCKILIALNEILYFNINYFSYFCLKLHSPSSCSMTNEVQPRPPFVIVTPNCPLYYSFQQPIISRYMFKKAICSLIILINCLSSWASSKTAIIFLSAELTILLWHKI